MTDAAPDRTRHRRLPGFPLVVLIIGFGFSAAINIIATWGAYQLVMGGVMASLALPAAIHMWPMVPRGWGKGALRAVVMTAIAGMAAYITFRHGAQVMTPVVPPGGAPLSPWDQATAYLYTLITEALVVLGVMAHRAPRPAIAPSRVGATDRRANETPLSFGPSAPVEPVAEPAPVRDLRAGSSVRDRVRAEYLRTAREVLAQGGALDTIVLAQVDERAGASKGYAKKFAADWRRELETDMEAVG